MPLLFSNKTQRSRNHFHGVDRQDPRGRSSARIKLCQNVANDRKKKQTVYCEHKARQARGHCLRKTVR